MPKPSISTDQQDRPARPNWSGIAERLVSALRLSAPPVAISFHHRLPEGAPTPTVAPYGAPFAPATDSGRTGRVAAGCVFWIEAATAEFSTVADDHANCSVGSVTHGFKTVPDVVGNDDIDALLESGWVDESVFATLPVVAQRPDYVVYGPLATTSVDPDVVLVRIDGRGLMTIKDTVPDLAVEGKPQCHIVAMAKETRTIAASVGCALSRARTGMHADEMTCVFPADVLPEVLDRLEQEDGTNSRMARYAGVDARRFA
jgi:uncharacterized protein (DUF169 family)